MDIAQKPAWGMDSLRDPRDRALVNQMSDPERMEQARVAQVGKNLKNTLDPNSTEPIQSTTDGIMDRFSAKFPPKKLKQELTDRALNMRQLALEADKTNPQAAATYRQVAKMLSDRIRKLDAAEAEHLEGMETKDTGTQNSQPAQRMSMIPSPPVIRPGITYTPGEGE